MWSSLLRWSWEIVHLVGFYYKKEALDRTVWRTGFERGYGPVVRQTVTNGPSKHRAVRCQRLCASQWQTAVVCGCKTNCIWVEGKAQIQAGFLLWNNLLAPATYELVKRFKSVLKLLLQKRIASQTQKWSRLMRQQIRPMFNTRCTRCCGGSNIQWRL